METESQTIPAPDEGEAPPPPDPTPPDDGAPTEGDSDDEEGT